MPVTIAARSVTGRRILLPTSADVVPTFTSNGLGRASRRQSRPVRLIRLCDDGVGVAVSGRAGAEEHERSIVGCPQLVLDAGADHDAVPRADRRLLVAE